MIPATSRWINHVWHGYRRPTIWTNNSCAFTGVARSSRRSEKALGPPSRFWQRMSCQSVHFTMTGLSSRFLYIFPSHIAEIRVQFSICILLMDTSNTVALQLFCNSLQSNSGCHGIGPLCKSQEDTLQPNSVTNFQGGARCNGDARRGTRWQTACKSPYSREIFAVRVKILKPVRLSRVYCIKYNSLPIGQLCVSS